MASRKLYRVPETKMISGMLHTGRCHRCGVAVVATDYTEPELNGTQRHVWLDARSLVELGEGSRDYRCTEHACDEKNKKPGKDQLFD